MFHLLQLALEDLLIDGSSGQKPVNGAGLLLAIPPDPCHCLQS